MVSTTLFILILKFENLIKIKLIFKKQMDIISSGLPSTMISPSEVKEFVFASE